MHVDAVIRLLRPGDWLKNLFVVPAFFFALPMVRREAIASGEPAPWADLVVLTILTFIAFCLVASAVYAFNDVCDAASDRNHPIKRKRPVASGQLTAAQALAISLILVVAGLVLGFFIGLGVGVILAVYLLLQLGYNAGLKRIMLLDTSVLAAGFGLRSAAGALAISVPISIWLLGCVFFLTLYLAFTKRLCDLSSEELRGDGSWRSPAGYNNRIELNWLLGVSATLAMVAYLVYAMSDHAYDLFGPRAFGFALLSPLVLIAIHRFYRVSSEGRIDSPLDALISDGVLAIAVVVFGIGILIVLYVPQVHELLGEIFDVGAYAERSVTPTGGG